MIPKRVVTAGLAVILVLACVHKAQAELSVEGYCQLSVERLRQARESLERDGRLPNSLEQAALFGRYGTTEEEYLAFGSANAQAVEDYLAMQPDLRAQFDTLRAEMDALIAQREGAS